MTFLPVLVIFGLAILLIGLLRTRTNHQVASVKGRHLMSPNEAEFFGRLKRALPNFEVLAQVSWGALVEPNVARSSRYYWPIKRAYTMRIADYVICARNTMAVVAVVELDDFTHDNKQSADSERDALLASLGFITLRWDSRKKPSQAEIATQVHDLLLAKQKNV